MSICIIILRPSSCNWKTRRGGGRQQIEKEGERLLLSFYAGHLREDLRFVEMHLIKLGWEFKLSNRRGEFNIYIIFNI